MEKSGRTLLAKIWDQHVIARISDDTDLLHVDRHLLHDLGGSRGLLDLKSRGLKVHNPELTFATPDHAISTARGRAGTIKIGQELLAALRVETSASGIQMFDVDESGQGIVHVIGPELGLSLPGCLIVCGDSHTCTHGGMGALAFGIGSSELTHVLATQALIQRRPKTMRVKFEGKLPLGVTAKDMILALIGHVGAAGGTGYAVEYAGSTIRDLPIEGRLTICNLSIELGAKIGMVAPDEKTFEYLRGRLYAPQGEIWEQAVKAWRQLPSDLDANFDKEVLIDVTRIIPQVTWGISPEHVVGVDGRIPDPRAIDDPARRAAVETALDYMGLKPGSETIKRDAVAEGLDRLFTEAGFEWREPGCSMCLAANGETVAAGQRSISTSNRNFVGRQGPRARTHLASPASAAAAAITGAITDVRTMER